MAIDDVTRDEGGRGALPLWSGLAMLVAVAHAASLLGTGPVDDDYIVYRYAAHWLDGHGLVFNVGDPAVEGATSPLWLAVCGVGVWLGIDPAVWSPAIGILSVAVLVVAVGRCAQRLFVGPIAALAPWLVALSPAVAWHANAGLGTVPTAAAVAIGVERLGRWSASGSRAALLAGSVAFSIAVALRAEVAVVWIAWGLARLPRRGELAIAALPAVVLLVTTAVRWGIYGTLLPHAYYVKTLPLAVELEYGARYLVRSGGEGGLALLLLLGAFVPRDRAVLRAIGIGAVLALIQVLVVGGDWMVYGRFLVPYAALAALAATASIAALGSARARVAASGAAVALTLGGLVARPQAVFEAHFFEDWWRTVGSALRDGAPEGARVAISPIGAFGWSSRLPVVDVLGLTHDAFLDVDPDLEGVGVKGHHRHDGAWVLDQEPDYLLLGNAVLQPGGSLDVNPWEADVIGDERFARDYVARSLTLERQDGSLQVLPYHARRGAPPLR
ncbi:MAG: hypothetical protein AAF726_18255 [Planctomycetota bacterium]